MQTVFEANNELEAQMILDLLRRSGIDGELAGESLPGAMGELQAIGLVRVLARPEDASSARRVIRDWEAATPSQEPDRRAPSQSRGFVGFVLGASTATGLVIWANWTPVTTNGIDFDRNGELDEKWYWEGDLLNKVEVDRNLDGEVDWIAEYRDGVLYEAAGDENFDGQTDTHTQYERHNPYRVESAVNSDIGVEYRAIFEDGILRRVHLVDPKTGRVRKIQTFRHGSSLVEAAFDSDGDGSMDVQVQYGPFEEETRRTLIGE